MGDLDPACPRGERHTFTLTARQSNCEANRHPCVKHFEKMRSRAQGYVCCPSSDNLNICAPTLFVEKLHGALRISLCELR